MNRIDSSNLLSPSDIHSCKKTLRKEIRKQRRALSQRQQHQASRGLKQQIHQSRLLLRHRHIALYIGNNGELNPESLLSVLWQQKKRTYLPVIHPLNKKRLTFCEITPQTTLILNRFGIKEPIFKHAKKLPMKFLSLVLMPLVAFDRTGNRMGMGGGFYDRCFAYKFKASKSKPTLVGIAHAFQERESLPIEEWDVPLQAVITELAYHSFSAPLTD